VIEAADRNWNQSGDRDHVDQVLTCSDQTAPAPSVHADIDLCANYVQSDEFKVFSRSVRLIKWLYPFDRSEKQLLVALYWFLFIVSQINHLPLISSRLLHILISWQKIHSQFRLKFSLWLIAVVITRTGEVSEGSSDEDDLDPLPKSTEIRLIPAEKSSRELLLSNDSCGWALYWNEPCEWVRHGNQLCD